MLALRALLQQHAVVRSGVNTWLCHVAPANQELRCGSVIHSTVMRLVFTGFIVSSSSPSNYKPFKLNSKSIKISHKVGRKFRYQEVFSGKHAQLYENMYKLSAQIRNDMKYYNKIREKCRRKLSDRDEVEDVAGKDERSGGGGGGSVDYVNLYFSRSDKESKLLNVFERIEDFKFYLASLFTEIESSFGKVGNCHGVTKPFQPRYQVEKDDVRVQYWLCQSTLNDILERRERDAKELAVAMVAIIVSVSIVTKIAYVLRMLRISGLSRFMRSPKQYNGPCFGK